MRTSPHITNGAPPSETDAGGDPDHVRQGDIIQWESAVSPWRVMAVIVTADCDIVESKHAGTLSYVPVLGLHDYWRLVTLPRMIDNYLAKTFRRGLVERVKSLRRTFRPEFPDDPSEDAIFDILRLEPGDMMKTLGIPESEQEAPLRHVNAYKAALTLTDDMTVDQLATIMAELRVASDPKKPPSAAGVLDDLPESVTKLPGDAFFIGRIAGVAESAFVAYLRLVRELSSAAVAILPRELRRSGVQARRIAHLRSPFVYRLTQQLAQVFSDIGLPRDYETQRKVLAGNVRHGLPSSPPK